MGKKGGAKMPSAPDYTSLANQQAAIGKQNVQDQTMANRPNQVSTEGSLSWSQDPTTGAWTQTNQLNQPQQDLYDSQLANQQALSGAYGSALKGFDTSQVDLSGAPAMGQVGQFNQQATDLYRQLGQPDLDRSQNARMANLAARGISDLNSGAGANLMAQLGDQTNRFGMEAAQRGIAQGNTMFDQQNKLHQQGVSDILGEKQANLGMLGGLSGMTRYQGANPTYAGFTNAGIAPTPDLMGAASKGYDAQVAQANAKNAGKSNLLGGLMGIAGTALGGPIGSAIGTGIGGLFGGSGGSSAGSYDASTWK